MSASSAAAGTTADTAAPAAAATAAVDAGTCVAADTKPAGVFLGGGNFGARVVERCNVPTRKGERSQDKGL